MGYDDPSVMIKRRAMELRIAKMIQVEIKQFEDSTDTCIEGIDIEIIPIQSLGQRTHGLCTSVTVKTPTNTDTFGYPMEQR